MIPTAVAPIDGTRTTQNTSLFLRQFHGTLQSKSSRPVYFQFPHLRPERSGPRSNFSGGHTQEGVRSDVIDEQKA
nr:unnamed protein product [Spirometra erinaceieuropaei]